MKRLRPGILSVRAINQYRRRDVLSYLGLRYYLQNLASRTDQWAEQVAVDLVLTRTVASYFHAYHFKETTDTGIIEHRAIFLPGANEALAEAALLKECANRGYAFGNPSCVFSYELNHGSSRSGVFRNYMDGIRARQQAVAKACDATPNGIVLYTDIKRFYPSIRSDLAMQVWRRQSDIGNLPGRYRDLGEKLITEYSMAGNAGEHSILTGPMFSHLLGNLVLREIDDSAAKLPVKYFRYVDDIILVGSSDAVVQSLGILRSRFGDLGLILHNESSSKNIKVPTREWLRGRNDFQDPPQRTHWLNLIRDLKRFLLLNPRERENLQEAFRNEGIRIPIRDYSNAVLERSFLEGIGHLIKKPWFRWRAQAVSIQSLLYQAKELRKKYEGEFRTLTANAGMLSRFERKRRIPKLRYRAGRLIYLAPDSLLESLCRLAHEFPELHFHAQVMDAVARGNVDRLLPMGSNAAQAAAQPLRAAGRRCTTTLLEFSSAADQSLSVFLLNGVSVDRPKSATEGSDLMRFASSGSDIGLMKDSEPFIRELACLHGITESPRHPEILEDVFDKDEDLAMDAIDHLQQSISL